MSSTTGYEQIDRYNQAVINIQREKGLQKLSSYLPAEGHTNWLGDQQNGQWKSRRPFPERTKISADFNGHPWVMPFKTIVYVAKNINEITKEEFLKILNQDFKDIGFEVNLSYLESLNEEVFKTWFKDIATNALHANDAWTSNALSIINLFKIDLRTIESHSLNFTEIYLLMSLKKQVTKAKEAKDVFKLIEMLKDNENYSELARYLLQVHTNWRRLKEGCKLEDRVVEANVDLDFETPLEVKNTEFRSEVERLKTRIYTYFVNPTQIDGIGTLETEIDSLWANIAKSNISAVDSLSFLFELTKEFKVLADNIDNEEAKQNFRKLYQKYFDWILLDANPGVINGILKAAGQADQLEG